MTSHALTLDPAVLPRPSPPAQAVRGTFGDRPTSVAFAQHWRRTRRWVYLACDLAHLVVLLVLAWSGHPAWRLTAFAGALLIAVALHLGIESEWARRREERDGGALRGWSEQAWLLTMLVEIALSGGIHSPLFPSNLAAIPINLIQFGLSRSSNVSASAIIGSAIAFLLVPAAWLGPALPEGVYWFTLAISAGTTAFVSVYYRNLLARVGEESFAQTQRTREALAAQAVARARELEQLSAKISHELKNPLSAIKTLVQVSARAATDPESRERLEVVVREVRRIEATLRDYLAFSRPMDELSPRAVSLARLVDDTLALVEGRAREARVRLERVGEGVVEADARRLSQALLNLVVNALEACSAGGSITVFLSVDREAQGARLSVRDSGAGMTPDTLARLGTPFFTTRGHGTGLGVSLARACFEQHGGSLHYESTAGEGTVATALLPLLQRERSSDGAYSDRR